MTSWLLAALVLMLGGLAPALLLGSRRGALDRLVGLELGSALTVLVLLELSHGYGASSYLIVPLVLAVLSFAGTLVFVRLIGLRG
ncbi:monovalent cation/H+ antiporter complex subunit F [Rhizomonospora bruguierae]|uniref:monovalent cation/H+ antiporter complex subunit F n=1 Tax=Rhizomonospora bruguierae TaxID=1581705 RepID=UPI001BCF687B|nr:monovalent cation/H+ antiporter complex subunit F [Micromonospora sp. NBRC 107566]